MVAIPGVGRVFDPPTKFNIDGVTEKVKSNNSEENIDPCYLLVASVPVQDRGGYKELHEEAHELCRYYLSY